MDNFQPNNPTQVPPNRFHFQAYSISNGEGLPPFHLLNFFASDSFCGSLILTSSEFTSFQDFLSHSGIEITSNRERG